MEDQRQDFNVFHIIKAMSIRELTWQIKQVVSEAQNFTGILPSLRIFSLKTYEISDLGQLKTRLGTRQRHHIDLQYDRLGTKLQQVLELTQLFHYESNQSFMTSFVTSLVPPLVP